MTTVELAKLSFEDLVRKVGGTPDNARPVVFPAGNNQFKSPGSYAQDPLSSKQVYCDEVDAMYEYIQQVEQLPFGFNDVAVCMTRVLRRCDGGVARSVKSPFKLAQERVVETGYDRTGTMQHETIPGDWMTIPGLDGKCRATPNPDGSGTVQFQFRRFCQDAINGFFAFIREELAERSIYRGQIITSNYEYINVANFDRNQVVYNAELQEAVKVACISPIVDHDELIKAGERPKRSVLLAGKPGTGKTLLFNVAQSLLFEIGYTGVTLPPGSNAQDMANGLRVARNYMRKDGIVGLFIEDIEKMADKDRALALDNLDGAVSKSDRILIMMTTNFPDQINSAFLRQGRVDDFIEVGLPDLEAFTRLIQLRLKEKLDKSIDWETAFAAYDEYTPAWIVGGMSKVIRSVIARTHSADNIVVTTQDLVTGATLMRRQWELQDLSAKRAPVIPALDVAFKQAVQDAVADGVRVDIASVSPQDVFEQAANAIDEKLDGAPLRLKTEMGKPIEGNLGTNG
jgi:hypothetical protein